MANTGIGIVATGDGHEKLPSPPVRVPGAAMEELLRETPAAGDIAAGVDEALADLLEATEGSREIVVELIQEFLCCYRDRLARMAGAISDGNAHELERHAHQFKGCMGLFCRTTPLKLTERLMELGELKRCAEAPQTLELLEREVELLVARLVDFCNFEESAAPQPGEPVAAYS